MAQNNHTLSASENRFSKCPEIADTGQNIKKISFKEVIYTTPQIHYNITIIKRR